MVRDGENERLSSVGKMIRQEENVNLQGEIFKKEFIIQNKRVSKKGMISG